MKTRRTSPATQARGGPARLGPRPLLLAPVAYSFHCLLNGKVIVHGTTSDGRATASPPVTFASRGTVAGIRNFGRFTAGTVTFLRAALNQFCQEPLGVAHILPRKNPFVSAAAHEAVVAKGTPYERQVSCNR